MRSLRLARIAARAELLRLRLLARRHAVRAMLGLAALVFLLAALIAVHVAGAMALAERVSPIQAALIVAGIDLVLALILGALAVRDRPGPAERDALAVRRTAVDEVVKTALLTVALTRLLRIRSVRSLVEAALAAFEAGARR